MRILLRIVAVLIGLPALAVLVVGVIAAAYVGPDDTVPLSERTFEVDGIALATNPGLFTIYGPTLRVKATSAGGGSPLFIGVAPSWATASYLNGKRQTRLTEYSWRGNLATRDYQGQESITKPVGLDFWTAVQQGTTEANLNWTLPNGAYDLVVMRSDGAILGQVQIDAGLQLAGLFWTLVLVAAGGALGLLVTAVVFWLTRRRGASQVAAGGPA